MPQATKAAPKAKPETKSAIEDLIMAQSLCHEVIRTKSGYADRYRYADLKDVFDACKSAFKVQNFAIYHVSGQDDYGMYVTTVLHHRSGEKFESKIYLVFGKNDMQSLGSAHTYARRYGLLELAAIAPEDDDGEATKGTGFTPVSTSSTPPKPKAANERHY